MLKFIFFCGSIIHVYNIQFIFFKICGLEYNKKEKNIFYIIDKIELIFRVPYNIILYVKWGTTAM